MKHLIDKWTEKWKELGESTTASIPEYDLVAEFIADLKKEAEKKYVIISTTQNQVQYFNGSKHSCWSKTKSQAFTYNTEQEAEEVIKFWPLSWKVIVIPY